MKKACIKYFILLAPYFFLLACSRAPICHYSGQNQEPANAGCLVVDDNRVLLVEGSNAKLSLPGGGKKANEAPQCTAERETWEESGIEVLAKEHLMTFANGFQLFACEPLPEQALDGSAKPWGFEIKAIYWLDKNEFGDKTWRFPEQVQLIKNLLEKTSKEK